MSMSEEMKKQIIKAHIYGYDEKKIAEAECITISEVREALTDTELIEKTKQYMTESGWLQA